MRTKRKTSAHLHTTLHAEYLFLFSNSATPLRSIMEAQFHGRRTDSFVNFLRAEHKPQDRNKFHSTEKLLFSLLKDFFSYVLQWSRWSLTISEYFDNKCLFVFLKWRDLYNIPAIPYRCSIHAWPGHPPGTQRKGLWLSRWTAPQSVECPSPFWNNHNRSKECKKHKNRNKISIVCLCLAYGELSEFKFHLASWKQNKYDKRKRQKRNPLNEIHKHTYHCNMLLFTCMCDIVTYTPHSHTHT